MAVGWACLLPLLAAMNPDPTYKQIFAHSSWSRSRCAGLWPTSRACANSSTRSRLHEQSATGDMEEPRKYADDMVWRVRFRGRSKDEGDDAWLYLVLVLEFQAEVAFHGRRAGPGHRRSRRRRLWGAAVVTSASTMNALVEQATLANRIRDHLGEAEVQVTGEGNRDKSSS